MLCVLIFQTDEFAFALCVHFARGGGEEGVGSGVGMRRPLRVQIFCGSIAVVRSNNLLNPLYTPFPILSTSTCEMSKECKSKYEISVRHLCLLSFF